MLTLAALAKALEQRAPAATAESWDNVGLLAGDPAWKTAGAVVSIDLTRAALDTARKLGYRAIVTHHPPIFPKSKGLARVVAPADEEGDSVSSLVFEAIRHGIGVVTSHTNFDQCALEVVHAVSRGLGVTPQGRLQEKPFGDLQKLVVFVPVAHLEQVRAAICEAGAGHIGGYDSCAFGVSGEGTFRGGKGTRPFIGKAGQLEKTQEIRLETVVPRGLSRQVVAAMLAAHPYEEAAYDLYPLEQAAGGANAVVRGLGYGFWGECVPSKPFSAVAKSAKVLFQLQGYWLTEPSRKPASRKIRKVAFVAGKGSSFIGAAAAHGCDLFITGEAGYHAALDGANRGMAVMEIGHRESELFFLKTMAGWLADLGLKASPLNRPTQRIF